MYEEVDFKLLYQVNYANLKRFGSEELREMLYWINVSPKFRGLIVKILQKRMFHSVKEVLVERDMLEKKGKDRVVWESIRLQELNDIVNKDRGFAEFRMLNSIIGELEQADLEVLM